MLSHLSRQKENTLADMIFAPLEALGYDFSSKALENLQPKKLALKELENEANLTEIFTHGHDYAKKTVAQYVWVELSEATNQFQNKERKETHDADEINPELKAHFTKIKEIIALASHINEKVESHFKKKFQFRKSSSPLEKAFNVVTQYCEQPEDLLAELIKRKEKVKQDVSNKPSSSKSTSQMHSVSFTKNTPNGSVSSQSLSSLNSPAALAQNSVSQPTEEKSPASQAKQSMSDDPSNSLPNNSLSVERLPLQESNASTVRSQPCQSHVVIHKQLLSSGLVAIVGAPIPLSKTEQEEAVAAEAEVPQDLNEVNEEAQSNNDLTIWTMLEDMVEKVGAVASSPSSDSSSSVATSVELGRPRAQSMGLLEMGATPSIQKRKYSLPSENILKEMNEDEESYRERLENFGLKLPKKSESKQSSAPSVSHIAEVSSLRMR